MHDRDVVERDRKSTSGRALVHAGFAHWSGERPEVAKSTPRGAGRADVGKDRREARALVVDGEGHEGLDGEHHAREATGVVGGDARGDDGDERRGRAERGDGAADAGGEGAPGRTGVRSPADLLEPGVDEILAAVGDELAGDAHRVDDRVGELGACRGLALRAGPAEASKGEGGADQDDGPREKHGPDGGLDRRGDSGPEDDARGHVDRRRDPLREGRREDLGVGDERAEHGA